MFPLVSMSKLKLEDKKKLQYYLCIPLLGLVLFRKLQTIRIVSLLLRKYSTDLTSTKFFLLIIFMILFLNI